MAEQASVACVAVFALFFGRYSRLRESVGRLPLSLAAPAIVQMGVNHFGHVLLTMDLIDIIEASAPSRVVVVSSRSHTRVNGTGHSGVAAQRGGCIAQEVCQLLAGGQSGMVAQLGSASCLCGGQGEMVAQLG